MIIEIGLLLVAFVVIWLATGFAIEALEKIAGHTRLTRFTLSLFVVGLITSFPELSIMVNALLLKSPQIALGNLIGSQIFLLFIVIPVLAILSRGLQLPTQMKNISLPLTLLVTLAPILALLNQGLELSEVLMILGIYVVFVLAFKRFAHQNNLVQRVAERMRPLTQINLPWEILKLAVAIGILMLASNSAVRAMIEIAAWLQTPRFLLSLLILPIGTNLPELSLALGSLVADKKNLALGDYLGSLTFNSLLIVCLALFSGGTIMIGQNISLVIAAFVIGVVIFGWYCYSQTRLSIKEGLALLLVYAVLISLAIWQIMSGIAA